MKVKAVVFSKMAMSDIPEFEPPPTIRLDHFIKMCGIVDTGGQAKQIIQAGEVLVNGRLENRRRKQLLEGDVVTVNGEDWLVERG